MVVILSFIILYYIIYYSYLTYSFSSSKVPQFLDNDTFLQRIIPPHKEDSWPQENPKLFPIKKTWNFGTLKQYQILKGELKGELWERKAWTLVTEGVNFSNSWELVKGLVITKKIKVYIYYKNIKKTKVYILNSESVNFSQRTG